MNLRHHLLNASLTVSAAFCATSSLFGAEREEHPNLLYIFPDQYRMQALSLWNDPAFRDVIATVGDPVHTPNIDRLAKEGVLFSQATSTHPLSSPHRAMMITGMFPSQNGVEGMNCYKGRTQGVRDEIVGFTDVLANAGYETAYVGKVHWLRTEPLFDEEGNFVGTSENPGGHYTNVFDTYVPEGRGRHGNRLWFQQFVESSHFDMTAYSNMSQYVSGKKDGDVQRIQGIFSATNEANIIIDFLKNKGNLRDTSKPFSLIWSINPPHNPYSKISDCDVEVFNKYYRDLAMGDVLLRENVKYGEGTSYKTKETLTQTAKVYFSLIKSIDDEIGRVLATLEAEGLDKNTVIVFTSDHGEMMGSHGRGGKSVIYDESFLVPFIVRYPEKIQPHVTDLLIGSTDIMPTILSLMGFEKEIPASVMGLDYADGLVSGNFVKNAKPTSAIFLNGKNKGVRTNRYTYMVENGGGYLLFDNEKDPYQLKCLALEDIPAEDAQLLKSELGRWLTVAKDGWAAEKRYSHRVIY